MEEHMQTYLDAARTVRPLADNETLTHEQGIAFVADKWTRLRRFLILGSEGTYYVKGPELTKDNLGIVKECLDEDGMRALGIITDIEMSGRAPKHDPVLLALALATCHDNGEVRRLAYSYIKTLCRTGTHLLHFVAYVTSMRGWSRGLRRGVAEWFTSKTPRDLAYQALKYQQRDGWSLDDVFRLSHTHHTKATVEGHLRKWHPNDTEAMTLLDVAKEMHLPEMTPIAAYTRIRHHRLTREMVPTHFLTDPEVWDALLDDMPMTAMIRNLGTMSKVGLLTNGSEAMQKIVIRLAEEERLRKARVHPIAILAALKVYEQGHGERGKGTWTPVKAVVNALDNAFYLAFGNVTPTGKRIRLALDVSASMDGNKVVGMPFLDARMASAAMALVTAAVEPNHEFVAYSHTLVPLTIRPSMRLDEVIRTLQAIPMGGTYCSLPIMDALMENKDVDAFISYTDSETWDGSGRVPMYTPFAWAGYGGRAPEKTAGEYLNLYRQKTGIPAKHAVVAFASNGFSIADPNDPGQLDVCGLDSATPQVLSDFISGGLDG
jgi:60 kDa SS-A/Ro ribonucleoprotein